MENYTAAGKRVLIVANHTSFLDGVVLGSFLPDELCFAVNTRIARRWYFKPFLSLVDFFQIDPGNSLSLKSLIQFLKHDRKVVIFPEGRITVTGSLMKIYYGPGMVADHANASVLPIRIDGAQYTPFSRLRGRVRLRWFPRVSMTIMPPRKICPPESLRGRERRNWAGQELSAIMTEMMFATTNINRTLMQAVIDAMHIHGGGHIVADDPQRQPMTYRQLVSRSATLGVVLAKSLAANTNVGVLMPNSNATAILLFGLHQAGRVPAFLDYRADVEFIRRACRLAKIHSIITSRRFSGFLRLEVLLKELGREFNVIYLEDVAGKLGVMQSLTGHVRAMLYRLKSAFGVNASDCQSPAVILYNVDGQGNPRGVVLSHRNLLANCAQISSKVDYKSQDIVFNVLPPFHSFGMTAGTLLPLISGMKVFFYPVPGHYRIVPDLIYDVGTTIMLGTDSLLREYARHAHPYDFYTVRYVFAGDESLQESTRQMWSEKFGVRVLEGFGVAEASPVIATNSSMENKLGTVGRILPGIEYHIEPSDEETHQGRLSIRGPNIMLGYLLEKNPGVLTPVRSKLGQGWYETGKQVRMDEDGFLYVIGS